MTELQKEAIYREYHDKVYGYIISKTNDRQNAEDIAADVFIKVYEKLDTFDARKASLSTWIYTITRNTLIDRFRTRKIFTELTDLPEEDDSAEDAICRAESLEQLADALKTLDKRERNIIILRFYSGLSLKEIAVRMNLSYAYVKALQKKALKLLKIFLEKE